ncbi:MAG: MBL fold metallo-hydrolase [SAR324 cluster bacterium]|nr:MBL fold metallo-hydrolase [SAR324 cluster bacterium]MCZ6647198.1 MBL fold metallo-hydrolase [SAR324 cluster bacterium]MCZ6728477.1 MBL fold metallo-hydrolase [SAR324 cluster bacterium]
MMEDLYFRQIQAGPMANFVYLIGSNATREAAIVDPAWQVEDLVKLAEQDEMKITSILVTHTHADHVGGDMRGEYIEGVAELLELCKAKVYVHKAEADRFAVPESEIVKTDEHSSLTLGDVAIEFIHTPGHTPGSQCFKIADRLVSGDTLFIGSCGRTDLPGSNPEDMYISLTQKLMKLDEQTIVFPGHNYAPHATQSSIEQEKASNPFMRFPSKAAFLTAMGYPG